jgi:hypothetical protein
VLAALEAQAGVEVREPRHVGEPADAPLLVVDEQQRGLGEVLAAVGERAQDAEREDVAPLHVDRPRADEPVALAAQRAVVLVGDHRVEVTEQQDAFGPGAGHPHEEIGRVVGRGARDALDLGVVRGQRGGDRGGLLGGVRVAARRRDGDERLELARGAGGDRLGVAVDPVGLGVGHQSPWRSAPAATIRTTSAGSSVQRSRST